MADTKGPDFSYYPLSLIPSEVRGESHHRHGITRWHVDHDGILHVTHITDDDTDVMTFRLIEVEQVWKEVDRG